MPLTQEELERELQAEMSAYGGVDPATGSPTTTPAASATSAQPAQQKPAPATDPLAPAPPPLANTAANPVQSTGAAQPTKFAPPPPPPPPVADPAMTMQTTAAGGAPQSLEEQLKAYATNWLSNPNRFTSEAATAARETGALRREQMEEDATRDIEEWAAGRGLVGSSLEGEQQVRLQEKLRLAQSQEEADILRMIAESEARDRLAAGQLGLDFAQYEGAMGLERDKMAQQNEQFMQQLGISQQEVDLRAQELQQRAQLEGRSLDLQEARDLANQELTREGMNLQLRMHTDQMTQREAEFARNHDLDERQFIAQQDQFAKQFGEQVASRLQQHDQFWANLNSVEERFAVDAGLRERALDLQAKGMSLDEAFRRAALAQEKQLTTRAQDIQKYGIDKESSYRYAALEQDGKFRSRALDLQGRGMDLDEAYRTAELEFRKDASDRQDRSTRLAVAAQLAGSMDGFSSANMEKLMKSIMGGSGVDLGGYSGGGGGGGGGSTPTYTPPPPPSYGSPYDDEDFDNYQF